MNKVLPVIEMFCSIQGEGKFAGEPSFFIRTSGCNLRCCFKGSICDTPYSSYEPEKPLYKTFNELIEAFNKLVYKYPRTKHIVITGGEPLLHRETLIDFLNKVNCNGNYIITIETNGTMMPIRYSVDGENANIIDLYSVSPKLANSVGVPNDKLTAEQIERHKKLRINPEALAQLYIESKNIQYKFVYSDSSAEKEIDNLMKLVEEVLNNKEKFKRHNIKVTSGKHNNPVATIDLNDYIMLMPEGITNDQLIKTAKNAANLCVKRGWKYTDRLHIRIWGDKRGV